MSRDSDAVEAVERILDGAADADQILRDTVTVLAEHFETGVGIRFVEEGAFTDGPWSGDPSAPADAVPIRYNGGVVAEIVSTISLDVSARLAWERVALLISAFCLVGWDTGGENWEP